MAGARRLALIVGLLCGASTRTVAQDEPGWLPTRPAAEASADTCPSLAAAPLACPTPRCPGGPLHGWVSAEYVYGWIGGATPPPLLSAAPVGGGPPTVLFGDDPLNDDGRSGFQLRGGFWLDESGTYGVEAGTFLLCQSADRARAEDTPGTVIGRPFFNAQLGAPDVELVSLPGALSGRAVVDAESSHFCAADIVLRKAICCDCRGRLDWLVGYRYLAYDDSVRVVEDLRPGAPFPPGSRIVVADEFTARNQFHGLLVGLAGEYRLDSWYVQARAGASIGRTTRRATVFGQTVFELPPAAPAAAPGGLFALSSNSGSFSETDWAVVPEASVRLGYQVSDHLRVFAGYSVLYWPSVYRAADQIDPVVNPDLLPPPIVPPTGPVRPLFLDRTSSLCVHLISVGVEFRY